MWFSKYVEVALVLVLSKYYNFIDKMIVFKLYLYAENIALILSFSKDWSAIAAGITCLNVCLHFLLLH